MIHRNRYESDYAIIPNSLSNDSSISFEARGLLLYLLSKPLDWTVVTKDLIKASPAGRDKIQRIINELITAGYLTRVQTRTADGGFSSTSIDVWAEPQPENPYTDKPYTAKPPLQRTDPIKSNKKSTKNVSPFIPQIPDNLNNSAFLEAWDNWNGHRKEIKKRQTPRSMQTQLKVLATIGVDRAIAAITHSIANGYTGIYEPKQSTNGTKPAAPKAPQYVPDASGRF